VSRRVRVEVLWWGIAVTLAVAAAAFPSIGGMVATNDDLKFIRAEPIGRGAWAAIAEAWRNSSTFRPLDLLLGSWCDPVTLAVGPAPLVQALGLAVLLLATALLARRAAPWFPSAGPIAAILVLLSPATTSALWQVDAASQTWSASLGVLAMVLALDAWRSPGGMRLAALGCIFLAGCTIKESFYGWSAAIGCAVALGLVRCRRDGSSVLRARAMLLLPVVAVPTAHLALRIATGALASAAQSDPGARYKAELGVNLLVNSGMAVAGSLANGPFHAVTDEAAPAAVRALPLLSALAALGALAAALALAAFHRAAGGFGRLAPALAAGAVGIACLVVYLPMGSVSELYCLGSNAPVAVALAVALCALWTPQADDERSIGRAAAVSAGAVLAAVGAFGLVGRAMHHRVTWRYAELANSAILDHVERVPPTDPASGRAAWVLFLPGPCILGRTYAQYVIPPAQAIGLDETLPWLARRDPSRAGVFTVSPAPGAVPDSDLVLDCASFPPRPHW
jgi:hypothetical protein